MPEVSFCSNEIQVFIVAGGKGTRSVDPQRAKILQEISDGVNLIELHLSQLNESNFFKVTFLLSHFSEDIINYLSLTKDNFPRLQIDWIIDVGDAGTFGALLNAVRQIPSERYMIILGDIAISADYRFLLDRWSESKAECAVVVHPNLHPFESDKVLSDQFDNVTRIISKNDFNFKPEAPIRSAAGVYFFSFECFEELDLVSGDIGSDFLSDLINNKRLFALNSSFFFSDTGTPLRLERVKKAYEIGALARRSSSSRQSIFIDRDGTLIPDSGTGRKKVLEGDIQESSLLAISRANLYGIPVFLVTNQPGIAKGELEMNDVLNVQMQIEFIAAKSSGIIDDFRFCPHHPDKGFDGEIRRYKGDCDCRKPKISLFLDLAKKHALSLRNATLIGDSDNDRKAAESAGMSYINVTDHMDFAKQMNLIIDRILNADK